MRLVKTSIVLIALMLLLVGAPTAKLRHIWATESSMEAGTWHIEMVDSDTGTIRYTSLALDALGRPHIGCSEWDEVSDEKYDLKYAWHDGASWHIETVDGEGWGDYASLELDGSDRPCISYYDYGTLGYAWHDGTSWHFQTVDSRGGYYTSLALDGLDRPHISYQGNFGDYPDPPNWDLKYAWHDGANWHVETVDGESDVGFYTSLALDGLDRPHISYYDDTLEDLKYAWHDGVNWHIETVDSEGGSYTSLALDSSGRPHIGYNGDAGLKYAWHDGVSWHIETVDSEGGTYVSLALDESGQPRIGYYGGSTLKYAWHDGSDWHIETVDSPWVGSNTSLALDESGYPHISYSGGGGLKYAYQMSLPPLSLEKQATPREGLRNNSILTYTLTLYGPGLSARLCDPLPDAVRYVSGSITSVITPAAFYSSTAKAVVWQGTLPTDTVQTIRFQVTPGITGSGSLSLSMPIVNTAWLTDTENRSVSATAIANGRYVYLPLVLRGR